MTDLRLSGAHVLDAEGWTARDLAWSGGIIGEADAPAVDLEGYRVLPGIVDPHGDGFERHMAPRRGALRAAEGGVVATAAELAANGITTGVMAQFWSWEGGMRGPDFAEHVFDSVARTRDTLEIDLRLQLRLETHYLESFARAEAAVARYGIDYVVFNDHLPHDRLAEGRRPPRLTGQALKSGRNPDAHFALLLELHGNGEAVEAALDGLAARLRVAGVRLGSHDDADAETRAAWRARGVGLSEFPETEAAALAARAAGEGVILGAPNVVRGASHKGNASAAELIAAGLCDALASDYHYPAPLAAVLRLVETGLCDWPRAWALVSSGPARLLGLGDRGDLVPGRRADLVILDRTDRVVATIAGGRVAYMTGAVTERFLRAG
ncbi:alpha-D-ribose 1-methylphosphonate 5-triphosphate diphosphatase [Roseivivax lentus]|uniref:Alpha-D-ribose 1-methylphosphonate 5-triphosphate diphosphatase n=1 Tax=Roseivivax lentus TaxID=633194 RepID=A0A1N7KZH4_9RHOB|nr:alpha-D-ribose 1-methylphosphonate 5-triphosphate diphosphatase [Roseivivax lentus]SIS66978.1 alpha-D-ribose 1-methylphosphonate 5-triphosphate diphosphatase [Roseivivax lentus]